MSEDQLQAFLDAVKSDADLQKKLKGAADAAAMVAIAKESGFVISLENLDKSRREMAEKELESIAGGIGNPEKTESYYSMCICDVA